MNSQQVQKTYFLDTKSVRLTQGSLIFLYGSCQWTSQTLSINSNFSSPISLLQEFQTGLHLFIRSIIKIFLWHWTQILLLWQGFISSPWIMLFWKLQVFISLSTHAHMHTHTHTHRYPTWEKVLTVSLPHQSYDHNHSGEFPSCPTIRSFSKGNWDITILPP